MHNKILHRFLSNNRALLSRTRTSFANLHLRIFKKKANFLLLFEYGYMRSNSACLGEYPTHRDVADMSNLFYFHFESIWSRRMTRLPSFHLSKGNRFNKNRYKHFSLARRKLYVRKYQLNDTDREKLCSIQFRTRMAGWLLLTFLIYLHNQLRSGSLNRE